MASAKVIAEAAGVSVSLDALGGEADDDNGSAADSDDEETVSRIAIFGDPAQKSRLKLFAEELSEELKSQIRIDVNPPATAQGGTYQAVVGFLTTGCTLPEKPMGGAGGGCGLVLVRETDARYGGPSTLEQAMEGEQGV